MRCRSRALSSRARSVSDVARFPGAIEVVEPATVLGDGAREAVLYEDVTLLSKLDARIVHRERQDIRLALEHKNQKPSQKLKLRRRVSHKRCAHATPMTCLVGSPMQLTTLAAE